MHVRACVHAHAFAHTCVSVACVCVCVCACMCTTYSLTPASYIYMYDIHMVSMPTYCSLSADYHRVSMYMYVTYCGTVHVCTPQKSAPAALAFE